MRSLQEEKLSRYREKGVELAWTDKVDDLSPCESSGGSVADARSRGVFDGGGARVFRCHADQPFRGAPLLQAFRKPADGSSGLERAGEKCPSI